MDLGDGGPYGGGFLAVSVAEVFGGFLRELLGFLLFDSAIVTVFAAATAYVVLGVAAIAALEWPYARDETALSRPLTAVRQESGS